MDRETIRLRVRGSTAWSCAIIVPTGRCVTAETRMDVRFVNPFVTSRTMVLETMANTKVKVAFLSDPWGTYIELNEPVEQK